MLLGDFNYREEGALPEEFLGHIGKGKLGTRTYNGKPELLTLIEEGLSRVWQDPEIRKELKSDGYDLTTRIPVLKIIGEQPNIIWYHPKNGKKLIDDVELKRRRLMET